MSAVATGAAFVPCGSSAKRLTMFRSNDFIVGSRQGSRCQPKMIGWLRSIGVVAARISVQIMNDNDLLPILEADER